MSLILSAAEKDNISRRLAQGMRDEVTLLFFVDGTTLLSEELKEFGNMMASLSQKIRVDVQTADDGKNEKMRQLHIENWPCMILVKGDFSRIRYYGIPLGYELPPVVDALIELSSSTTPLSPVAKTALSTVRRRANIKLFVLQTCHFCPTVARHSYRAAIESKNVTAEIIDSSLFPDLAARHSVMGVPKIILNDNMDITGAMVEADFFEKLRDSDHSLIDSMYG
jgi:glutaredoxin-like protein